MSDLILHLIRFILDDGWKLDYGSIPLAGNAAFLDNAPTMSTTTKLRSFRGRLEFRMISIGMSVFAYLLEKMILRSVKSGEAKPRGSRIS